MAKKVMADKDWVCMVHSGLYKTIPKGTLKLPDKMADWGVEKGRCKLVKEKENARSKSHS